ESGRNSLGVPGTPYTSLSETKRTGIAWQPLGFHMPIRRTEAKPRRCVGKEAASFPTDGRLRPPDPGTGRVAGRTSYLLAETGFERSLSERTRSLSEKQVKADKDLRRSAEERFFVFRGFRTFCLTAKSVS